MARKNDTGVYSIAFDERDAEILRLESRRADLTDEIEKTVAELAKLSGKRSLVGRRARINPLLLDGKNPDKL